MRETFCLCIALLASACCLPDPPQEKPDVAEAHVDMSAPAADLDVVADLSDIADLDTAHDALSFELPHGASPCGYPGGPCCPPATNDAGPFSPWCAPQCPEDGRPCIRYTCSPFMVCMACSAAPCD